MYGQDFQSLGGFSVYVPEINAKVEKCINGTTSCNLNEKNPINLAFNGVKYELCKIEEVEGKKVFNDCKIINTIDETLTSTKNEFIPKYNEEQNKTIYIPINEHINHIEKDYIYTLKNDYFEQEGSGKATFVIENPSFQEDKQYAIKVSRHIIDNRNSGIALGLIRVFGDFGEGTDEEPIEEPNVPENVGLKAPGEPNSEELREKFVDAYKEAAQQNRPGASPAFRLNIRSATP